MNRRNFFGRLFGIPLAVAGIPQNEGKEEQKFQKLLSNMKARQPGGWSWPECCAATMADIDNKGKS